MRLILEDGTVFAGTSFGAPGAVAGEVVFNTAMAGYVETLTDASYRGQILVATYPLVGSYGVPSARQSGSITRPFEAERVQVQGLVVQSYVENHSHHAAGQSLGAWLRRDGVAGLSGVDTRKLTRKLREAGTMKGWLVPAEQDLEQAKLVARAVEMKQEVFRLVAPPQTVRYEGTGPRILLLDVGAKDNLVRSMLERGCAVIRAPWHAPVRELAAEADGILIGNGPGDPKDLGLLIASVRDLLGSFHGPIFGVCLGHQILALAAGADTYKLPYGHRGVNQPVQDVVTGRCYVTSQNHGYAVRESSLPLGWEPWFVNVNDGTNEGIRARSQPFFSVQFHPEACPGPEDTRYLFDDFLRLAAAMARPA